ncbi:hypothetical protein N9993_00225 [bacterium]|nr:hypothetical protein [bacterium]
MKVLITGGCSFSADSHCWPVHLQNNLSCDTHYQTGVGSSGNDLISRKVIWQVNECLKKGVSPEDMLVGIMWSGKERRAFLIDSFNDLGICQPFDSETSPHEWPQVSQTQQSWWVLIGVGFNSLFSQNWYKRYQNHPSDSIYAYENILRTQWFLQNYNIKYFMTTYTDEVLRDRPDDNANYQHDYLKDMIDFEYFLPVSSEHGWCVENYNERFPNPGDPHPGNYQHKRFSEEVIIPYLRDKYDIT